MMKAELQKEILEKFSNLFVHDPNKLNYENKFDCGDGWHHLIHELCEKLSKFSDVNIAQFNEKFGKLRVFWNFTCNNEEARKLISEYQEKSEKVCEFCGDAENSNLYKRGWWRKTLCETHAREFYKGKYRYNYLCKNCDFNFDYEGELEPFQCPKCRCEIISKII